LPAYILFHNVVCLGLLVNFTSDQSNIHNLYLDVLCVAALLTCITRIYLRITSITHVMVEFYKSLQNRGLVLIYPLLYRCHAEVHKILLLVLVQMCPGTSGCELAMTRVIPSVLFLVSPSLLNDKRVLV
jgi:hypothetical protein